MLKRLHVREFTVFADATFEFGPGLNVLVGTNGTGKSHVLKLGYAMGVASVGITNLQKDNSPATEFSVPTVNALRNVFRFDEFWALKHNMGEGEVGAEVIYEAPDASLGFTLRRNIDDGETGEEIVYEVPDASLGFTLSGTIVNASAFISLASTTQSQLTTPPLFIPAKEVLSFYEGFAALYRKYNLAFDQTYLDLCEALSGPTLREPGPGTQAVLATLERLMQGRVALEGGRFYLYPRQGGRQEINMAAEGIRKFATLAQLLANGSLTPDATLFWDEPEANLNPALLQELAQLLVMLAGQGFQIILATHSLFLLKAFHILSHQQAQRVCYFGLSTAPGEATQVATTDDLTLLPDIAALDAELAQSDEFVNVLNAAGNEA